MSPHTRFRIVTALGLGAVFSIGGSIVGYLLVQAAALFTWPVIVTGFAAASVIALLLDLATERPTE